MAKNDDIPANGTKTSPANYFAEQRKQIEFRKALEKRFVDWRAPRDKAIGDVCSCIRELLEVENAHRNERLNPLAYLKPLEDAGRLLQENEWQGVIQDLAKQGGGMAFGFNLLLVAADPDPNLLHASLAGLTDDQLSRFSWHHHLRETSLALEAKLREDAQREFPEQFPRAIEIPPTARAAGRKIVPKPKAKVESKPKKSSTNGDGEIRLIAALTKHHRYADGGALNQTPVGSNDLARMARVSPSTASRFFKKQFQGYDQYRTQCFESNTLIAALKLLNRDFAPHELSSGPRVEQIESDSE